MTTSIKTLSLAALATLAGATNYGVAPAAGCKITTVTVKRPKTHRVHGKLRTVYHRVHGHRVPVMVVTHVKHFDCIGTTPAGATPAAAAPAAPAHKLRAKLDPSFTQDPSNPLAVTYSYDAGAFDEHGAQPLPEGVLTLYSDGTLECSINVGNGVEGGTCPVTYQATGAHTVVVTYSSGETTVTETSVEQIEPFTTTTTVEATYTALPAPSIEGYDGDGHTWALAGTLTVTAHTTVNGHQAPGAPVVTAGGVQLEGSLKVTVIATRGNYDGQLGEFAYYPQSVNIAPATGNTLDLPIATVEAGTTTLTASYAGGAGYAPSSATTPIAFSIPAWQ
jgi:hypothetical protein